MIEAEIVEKYGRRENVRTFGVEEHPVQQVFAGLVSVPGITGSQSLQRKTFCVIIYGVEAKEQNWTLRDFFNVILNAY